jgi:hypothetical protein
MSFSIKIVFSQGFDLIPLSPEANKRIISVSDGFVKNGESSVFLITYRDEGMICGCETHCTVGNFVQFPID